MKHAKNTTPNAGHSGLAQIVDSIISTKIEYANQQQSFLCKSLDILQETYGGATLTKAAEISYSTFQRQFDEILDQVDQLAYSIELLLIIRSYLSEETSRAIYELMLNDKYLFYAPEKLQQLLNLESFLFGKESPISNN